jgi:hypothetical protein
MSCPSSEESVDRANAGTIRQAAAVLKASAKRNRRTSQRDIRLFIPVTAVYFFLRLTFLAAFLGAAFFAAFFLAIVNLH